MGRRRQLLLVLAAALAVFFVLAAIIDPVAGGADAAVQAFAVAHRSPALTTFFKGYTTLGSWFVVVPVALLVVAALPRYGRLRAAAFVFVSMAAELVLNLSLKLVFQRARPPLAEALVHARGYAFPSGHSMASMTLALALIVVAWPTRWRRPVTALMLTFAVLMGMSRIYLGAHWLTDVLAAWAMSAAIVTTAYLVIERPAAASAGPAAPAPAGPAATAKPDAPETSPPADVPEARA